MSMEIYQEVLLQHSRRPQNFGPLEGATHRAEGVNALCGDEVTIELILDDRKIEAIKFTGQACAICMASASILTGEVKGAAIPEAQHLAEDFRRLVVTGEATERIAGRPRLEVMGSVHQFPQRVKCAALAWETMLSAIEHPCSGS